MTFDTPGPARPARPALPRPASRAPGPRRLAGGFVGPPRRLCRASPRACAGGARRRGAGGRGLEGATGTAPGGGWRGREAGQREGSRGCARLWAAAGVGRLVLGLLSSLFSPFGLVQGACLLPEGPIREPRLNAGVGRGSGGRRLRRTAARYISESPCGTPTPRPQAQPPSSQNPSSTPGPRPLERRGRLGKGRLTFPFYPLSDAQGVSPGFRRMCGVSQLLVTRPFWASGQPWGAPRGTSVRLGPQWVVGELIAPFSVGCG